MTNADETTAASGKTFTVENDTTAAYWHNSAGNSLPPPDMMGAYMRNRPVPAGSAERRKAWIIGSGIAGLAAAFYMIRDGGMAGEDITILDTMQIEGGSLDGAGNAEDGYIVRGGREMNWNYDNLWDMFQDVQALELPAGYSVLDEYRLVNDNDPNFSKARLMHKRGQIRDFSTLGLSKPQQWELIRLLLKRKEDLDDITIEQYFSAGFLKTNFWYLWRSMFAFENWQSLLEMKLYMHRFLDAIDGLTDMSALIFPKYNQFDSFVRPLVKHLRERGVKVQFDTRAYDLDMAVAGETRTVTAIRAKVGGADTAIAVGPKDLVFALTGSMTEGTAYGDMDNAPVLDRGRHDPGDASDWALWKNLARKSPIFGKPEKFYGNVDGSMWESVTLTCKPSAFVEKLKELSVNDPYSGKTVTGGIITFTDSNWVLSFTCNRQPHFPTQPKDVLVVWVYALLMDKEGNYVKKAMPACTGREILAELCYHLGIEDQLDDVAANTKARIALMPYITAQFMPRAAGDRPHVVPAGCTNLGLMGQFVETSNDIIFTMDSSIRTARVAVYRLLNLKKQVPDISPTQYDIRSLLKAARALNNGEPFPGERLLHRLLDKTYYAHILPPLPEPDSAKREAAEGELTGLLGKGNQALGSVLGWLEKVRESFNPHKR
ncbi:oleate hydratase [Phyllobacterium myrsinacearum]|uniref:Oleate hydratase n=1 Tax=Phyllobacterium myrsinacearum TaxID=28101 RepID=A0A2S9JQC3_9HYPH|nr:oleate hydratase [Phyllobacterium myrsinacearum]PRD55394.1 oleate hydratase [Phyllobacterium myrsinacearum]PWV91729.1 oleate hydratase [Phyllobacterium myrsinacearum]RZV05799.1 oleate hydratase [Phyllobacterium myrsinacearum]